MSQQPYDSKDQIIADLRNEIERLKAVLEVSRCVSEAFKARAVAAERERNTFVHDSRCVELIEQLEAHKKARLEDYDRHVETTKERDEWKALESKMERLAHEREDERDQVKARLDGLIRKIYDIRATMDSSCSAYAELYEAITDARKEVKS